ncbi:hypothetical protein [Rhizobium sp. RCAM05973]|uniref:hypothetical protein n=1 Tax=Rhizobium sp. RCAM05973 TaxID=2994066 RepID=UPI0022EBB6CD|nr:hypothetical protein [Rhizobium sp. RCAM05973]
MLKLKNILLGVLAAFSIATAAHSQTANDAIEQLPIRTLSHVLGHDGSGFVGREPVTDFIRPATTLPVIGNFAIWDAADGSLIGDGGTSGTAATRNTGASGATVPLMNGTNTWSGLQTYGAVPASRIDDTANQNRIMSFSTSGSQRWVFGVSGGTESGSNTS